MGKLNEKEINILIEALDEWEQKGLMSNLMGGLMGSMMIKEDEAKAEWEEIQEKKRKEFEMEQRERKEESLLLKAKLVGMKRDLAVEEANDILNKGKE